MALSPTYSDTKYAIDTSETAAILPSETRGSYEKNDEISDRPTNARTARSNVSARNLGRTIARRMSQNKIASTHAVCVAAIEIGAESAIRNMQTCIARLVHFARSEV